MGDTEVKNKVYKIQDFRSENPNFSKIVDLLSKISQKKKFQNSFIYL